MPAENSAARSTMMQQAACTASALSVVNALSEWMEVEIFRERHAWKNALRTRTCRRQIEGRGHGQSQGYGGVVQARLPDIRQVDTFFAERALPHVRVRKPICTAVRDIRWSCAPELSKGGWRCPRRRHAEISWAAYSISSIRHSKGMKTATPRNFSGRTENRDGKGAVEWAVAWVPDLDPFLNSYCNTILTTQGGTQNRVSAVD